MKPCEIYRKVKLWGLKGILDYFRRTKTQKELINFFLENAKLNTPRQSGITIIGNLSSQNSISKTLRDFAFSLKDANIPFQTFDYGEQAIPPEDIKPILTPKEEFRIKRYDHIIEMLSSPLPDGIVEKRGRILFWEFEHGLLETYPILAERPGDVISMSSFNFQYYHSELKGKRDVFKILYPLRVQRKSIPTKVDSRKQFGFANEDFIVFYNFSLDSGYHRKNPLGVLQVFALAFSDMPYAKLVFKISHVKGHEDRENEILSFAKKHGFEHRLVLLKDYLPQKDIFSLTNTCDVYLSMHRSEGFGLGIAEAMSLGKAVIVTDYSSVTEFCKPNNSILVPARLIPITPNQFEHPWYKVAKEWADPDINSAVVALKNLYANTSLRLRIGLNAQQFINDYFSIENFQKSVVEYLNH